MPLRKVLVTGANGFIGKHLCRKLLETNYEVIGLSRSRKPVNLISLTHFENFQVETGNIDNNRFLEDLFNRYMFDAIVNCAIAPPAKSHDSNQTNVQDTQEFKTNFLGTLNLLQKATQAGVKCLIQSSTMSVIDFNHPQFIPVNENHPTHPTEKYGFTKLLAENACNYYHKIFEISIIVLRYSGVYGLGKNHGLIAKFTQQCINESVSTFDASVNRTSDFVHVDDVVNANLLAFKRFEMDKKSSDPKCFIYNIGSGEESSVYQTAKIIKLITNSNCKINEVISESSRRFYFDCSKAQKDLKYNPLTLEEGLNRYISDVLKNK